MGEPGFLKWEIASNNTFIWWWEAPGHAEDLAGMSEWPYWSKELLYSVIPLVYDLFCLSVSVCM